MMETLRKKVPDTTAPCEDAGFLSRQRYRLEKAKDVLSWELGQALDDEGGRRGRAARISRPSPREEVLVWLERRLRRRLRAVERALEKIEEGTYGVCDATGKAIPARRLEAVPEAICSTPGAPQRRSGAGL